MDDLLKVRIISPLNVIFEGFAESISSTNSSGPFDILPQHANFITLIENSPIIIRTKDRGPVQLQFPLAIIYNINNSINIYTEINAISQSKPI